MKKKIMNKYPLVSVLIPTYNRPQFFRLALESVLRQTYKKLQIIICDNSTNKETEELIQLYKADSRICYIRNKQASNKEENFAPFESEVQGEYLQWLMDDDVLDANKIEKMIMAFWENPKVTIATSNRRWVDAVGHEIPQQKQVNLGENVEYAIIEGRQLGNYMLTGVRNLIGEPSAVLFRRSDLQNHYWQAQCRGYKTISDVVMWLELLEKGGCAFFQAPLSSYRRHQEQEGQQLETIILSRLEWLRLLGEENRKNFFISDNEYKGALQKILFDAEEIIRPMTKKIAGNRILQEYEKKIEELRRKNSFDMIERMN